MKLQAVIMGTDEVYEDDMKLFLQESEKYDDSIALEFNNQVLHVPKAELLKAVKVMCE